MQTHSEKLVAIVVPAKTERRSLSRVLTAEGFLVESFSPGAESLHAINPANYGCMIVDLDHSGGYSGEQTLLDAAREWSRELPVIVIASHSTRLPREAGLPMVAKSAGETSLLYLVYGALSEPASLSSK